MIDNRISVVRIIDRLNVGGPAIHAVLTTHGLDPKIFRTTLVIGSVEPGEASMEYLLERYGITCVVVPTLGRELRPLADIKTLWALVAILRRERPAIVHTHKAKAGALGRLAALMTGVPVRIHTYHGHVFAGYFSPRKTEFFLNIERSLARVTTKLVALSARLVDELADKYHIAPRETFTVIPLGFDLAPFIESSEHRGALRKKLGVTADTRLIGIVGRMVPVKDHATFIAAIALLAARRSDCHFVFIGGGELEDELKADVARRGLTSRAHFVGWQRDLQKIYPDLDVLALSSVNEGTPVALIEAMSCGVPVVATRVGGVADVLQNGARGELVPAKDPAAMADAIDRALLPSAAMRADNLRADVVKEFGADRLCGDLAQLYKALLNASTT